jgi:hypothetical protein
VTEEKYPRGKLEPAKTTDMDKIYMELLIMVRLYPRAIFDY